MGMTMDVSFELNTAQLVKFLIPEQPGGAVQPDARRAF